MGKDRLGLSHVWLDWSHGVLVRDDYYLSLLRLQVGVGGECGVCHGLLLLLKLMIRFRRWRAFSHRARRCRSLRRWSVRVRGRGCPGQRWKGLGGAVAGHRCGAFGRGAQVHPVLTWWWRERDGRAGRLVVVRRRPRGIAVRRCLVLAGGLDGRGRVGPELEHGHRSRLRGLGGRHGGGIEPTEQGCWGSGGRCLLTEQVLHHLQRLLRVGRLG